ncbi:MAG: hypothetical protein C0616_15400 [Desulfuromonas sp.]|nr:MAG: hypothetical protein C0616_15400 [Desulfuromonas sp.]
MIILAHDGSIYDDWVARYAIRFAAMEEDRKLLVLHVLDGRVSPEVVETRFNVLAGECASCNVNFLPQHLPMGLSVHRTLCQATPADPEALLVCGTRVRPRRQKYLSGTISEKLLCMNQCPVVAFRVVQPGLLGNPHDLLLPLAGHLGGYPRVKPLLRRFGTHLRSLHMCRAMQINPLRHPHLSQESEVLLKNWGHKYLTGFRTEMEDSLGPLPFRCDQRVMIATDWAHEILLQASRLKSQLMLLGLSERSLVYRVFHNAAIERILHETPCDVGIYRAL